MSLSQSSNIGKSFSSRTLLSLVSLLSDSSTIGYFLASLLLRLIYIIATLASLLDILVDITSNRAYALRSLLFTFLRGSNI